MSETTAATELTPEQWDAKFFKEYIRSSRFRRYTGTTENAIIQMREDLTKKKGDTINIPLVTKLKGAGVSGNTRLKGNEEKLNSYGWPIVVDVLRNAVSVDEFEEQKSVIDLRNAAKTMLKMWAMEQLRGGEDANAAQGGIIEALGAIYDGTTYSKYADATESAKDTWLANNSDRVLFGAAKSNNSSNDHSASLANIDNTADKLDAAMGSLAKRMAKTTTQKIRPVNVSEDEEWFVMFCNSLAFRDLKADSVMQQANREARERGKNNPLFTDGDLIYDGVIYREVPEIEVLSGVGAGSIDVAPNYLCGAQAVGIAWAQRTQSRTDVDDYDFVHGVAIQEIRGIRKNFFNNVQHGVVTVYTAGVADS